MVARGDEVTISESHSTAHVKSLPLVLVHGFLSGSDYWSDVIETLRQKREVIAINLQGFGERCHEPALDNVAAFANDVLEKLDAMGVKHFSLLGHSMGGMIAQEMAYKAPKRVRAMILFGTGAEGELPGRFEPIAESRRKVEIEGKLPTIAAIVPNWYLDGRQSAWYLSSFALAEKADVEAIKGGLTAMEAWCGVDYLAHYEMPCLILWSDRDRVYPFSQEKRLWEGIAGAQLAVIPNAGHNAHHEKPLIFCSFVNDFLNELTD